VFTCDPAARQIVRHAKDASLTVVRVVPSPGPAPSGLSWDGEHLWSGDAVTRQAYQHQDDEALTVKAAYPLPGHRPLGLSARKV